jgi:hypothetical protein
VSPKPDLGRCRQQPKGSVAMYQMLGSALVANVLLAKLPPSRPPPRKASRFSCAPAAESVTA